MADQWWTNDKPADAADTSENFWANDKPADAKPTGIARKAADLGLGFVSGALGATKSVSDAAGAGNAVSGALDSADKFVQSGLSSQAIADQQEQQAVLKSAQGKGIYEGVKAAGRAFAVAPVQTAVTGLGSVIPTIAAGLATGGASVPVSLGAMAAMGAAQGAGSIKGGIYDDIKQRSAEASMDPVAAEAAAVKAQEYGGPNTEQIALGAALGLGDSVTGVSKIATSMIRKGLGKGAQELAEGSARGIVARTAMGAAGEVPLEAAQGGQQQYASNVASQREGFAVNPWDNVASQGAFEGLASAGPGAAFGALHGRAAPAPGQDPQAPIAPDTPAPEPTPPGLGFNPEAGTHTVFPDGSVILNSDQPAGEQAVFDKRFAPQAANSQDQAAPADGAAPAQPAAEPPSLIAAAQSEAEANIERTRAEWAAADQRAKRIAVVGVAEAPPNSPLTSAAFIAVDSGAHDAAIAQQNQALAQAGQGQAATENVASSPLTAAAAEPVRQQTDLPAMSARPVSGAQTTGQAGVLPGTDQSLPGIAQAGMGVQSDSSTNDTAPAPTPQERIAMLEGELQSRKDATNGSTLGIPQMVAKRREITALTQQLQQESVNENQTSEAIASAQERGATEAEGEGLAGWASGHPESNEAALPHDSGDNPAADAETVGNIASAKSFIEKGLDGLDADTTSAVQRHMIRIAQNPKILKSVIDLIPVDVVNVLSSQQLTPEMLFHDPSMLKDGGVGRNGDLSVPVRVNGAAEVVSLVARLATENPAIFSGFDLGGASGGLSSASSTRIKGSSADTVSPGVLSMLGGARASTKGVFVPKDPRGITGDGSSAPTTIDGKHVVTPHSDDLLGASGASTPLAPTTVSKISAEVNQAQPQQAQPETSAAPVASAADQVAPRPANWQANRLAAGKVAKDLGINPAGMALGDVVAAVQQADAAAAGPVQLGRNNTPLSEGGKPYKTRLAASEAKKLQPMMRVVAVKDGFALAEKTEKQLAAEAKAARRLRNPQTSAPGEPIPAHAFIAAEGGLHGDTRPDMNVGINPRIGNRNLFAGKGKGLSLERATARLIEEGYLSEGASQNEAAALIKRSLTNPQYNADGIERIAIADEEARYAAYELEMEDGIVEVEALDDNEFSTLGDSDIPFGDEPSNVTTEAAMSALGFTEQEIQDEATANRSRVAQADSQGVRGTIEAAASDAQAGDGQRAPAQGQDEGLTAPSQQDILDQQARTEQADQLDAKAQIDREAGKQTLTRQAAPEQRTDTSGDMFAMEKATAEIDKRNAGIAAAKDPNQGGMFDDAPASVPAPKYAESGLPITDVRLGDSVLVDGQIYTVTGAIAGGVKAERTESYAPGMLRTETRFLKGDEVIEAKIAADKMRDKSSAEPTAITQDDVAAAKRQAIEQIEKVIGIMKADAVQRVARRFLPTMGVKVPVGTARIKAAMTGPAINLLAAASELWIDLPKSIKAALEADIEGRVSDASAAAPATKNDRDHFTLERINTATGKMEPVTFARGEYVRHTIGGKDAFGEIDGISQAKREFSVGGLWYPFGFAYKATKPEAVKPKTTPLSRVVDSVNKKYGQGLTEADAVPVRLKYAAASTIDTPAQGVLNNAIQRKEAAYQRLKTLRTQVKDGRSDLRLELIKAETAHKDAIRYVDSAQSQIEADANKQGLTTIKAPQFSRLDQDQPTANTAKTVRAALAKRFGLAITQMEKRGFLKIWDTTAQFNADGQNSRQIEGAAQGMWDGKVVHLFADGIEQGNEVAVMLHEVGEHASMQKMLGPEAYKRLVARAHELMRADDPTALEAVMRIPDDTPEKHLNSELLAYMIEIVAAQDAKATPGARKWLADVVAAIRAWWSQTGAALKLRDYGIRMELTPKDIAALAVRAVKWQGRQGRESAGSDTEPMFSRPSAAQPTGTASWNSPEPSKFDDLVYKLQDKQIDTKRVVESIRATAGALADEQDVYLQEELFHGRAAARSEDFINKELGPLVNVMRMSGLDIATLDEYLHARHAEEANIVIADRNPDIQDGGSGMTTQAAKDYFAKLDAKQRAKLEAAAARVDAILAGTRQLYADYDLESSATVAGWGTMFKHYVPLMREDKDGGMGIGQGFSIKGRETKGRTGSTRKVVDILANIAMQRERAIVRGEKNRVATALVGLAKANPNNDFWDVGPPPLTKVYDPKTNTVVSRPDPLYKSRENVVMAKIRKADGSIVEKAVVFNEGSERAVRMAAALKNLDAAQLEGLLGVSAKITRYFAAINTQYNPIFGTVNLVRDVQGALLNLGSTPLKGKGAEVAKHVLSALKGVYLDARAARDGKTPNSKWAALWDDFQATGGQTGFRDMFTTSADRVKAIQQELNPEAWMDSPLGKVFTANGALKVPLTVAQKQATGLFGWLSDYNTAMENAVRLSAYKVALEQGMSKQQAASLGKNLTVNFNRKGQVGQQAGALYAFFNASMQGTARLGKTLFDMEPGKPKTLRLSASGKKIVYGGVMLGVMQALMLSAAGFDDEEPPDFVRERSLIIPTGGKGYITIPMPLGLHVLPNLGRIPTEFALGGFKDPAEHIAKLLGLSAGAFNPIGGGASLVQMLSPTAVDPLVALAENKDWTGKPIAKTAYNKAIPGHALSKDTASAPAKLLAEAINAMTGGTKYTAGVLSPTPDQIDYLWGQATGGVGRELSKAQQAISAEVSGEDLPVHKIPLLGRFYGDADTQSAQSSKFYSTINRLNKHEEEIKGLRKDGRGAEVAGYMADNPDARLFMAGNAAERSIQKLRSIKRGLVAKDAPAEQVKEIERQITERMTRFNEMEKQAKERLAA